MSLSMSDRYLIEGGGSGGDSLPSRLIVMTFADASQAQGLYEALVQLDKEKQIKLEDAVFVSKNAEGELEVDEKVHREKRTGTRGGAVLGATIGLLLGGPVLGLAGGAVVGRLIGKRMDYGIDSGTVQSIANDLQAGETALFVMGTATNSLLLVEVFRKFQGKIVEATVSTEFRESLQKALESEG